MEACPLLGFYHIYAYLFYINAFLLNKPSNPPSVRAIQINFYLLMIFEEKDYIYGGFFIIKHSLKDNNELK